MDNGVKKQVYRVQGFSCSGCAATFEKNVKALPHVEEAQVNFGAAKLTVYGEASLAELEKAGAFEGLKLYPEEQPLPTEREPLWKQPGTIRTALSAVLLAAGWALQLAWGEASLWPVLFYGLSILIGGATLFLKGLRNLGRLQFDMNTLMTVAVIGAAIIGEWGEGATVVFLFAISEALESYSMDKARQSIRSLMEIAPKTATVRRNGKEMAIGVEDIRIGDTMIVKPGQKLAMDGVVRKGRSAVNQAAITGESIPVQKEPGDPVYAGTLNEEGLLEVEVTKRAEDTTLARIIHLVEEAQAERAPSQAFVDRFARYYTPAIMVVAAAIAILPPLFGGGDWSTWVYQGLAVLVVGCPCALVVSTPVAIVTAIGNAARNGVLIKGGIYLEEAGRLRVVAFDKTGTLTKGVPEVTDLRAVGELSETECLTIAASLENGSQHPLASAIVKRAHQAGLSLRPADNLQSITGKGLSAEVDGTLYYIGSPRLCNELYPHGLEPALEQEVHALQAKGRTVMLLGTANRPLAIFAVADAVRESSRETIARLKQLGIERTVMLTGDNQLTASAIAESIGIDHYEAELLPEQKLEAIKRLKQAEGHVAMVGDGVNDAPALAAATVGIAMGGAGTDTALETADIALMADDLSKLPFTIRLSRKALAVIKQNIAFALLLKAFALLLLIPGDRKGVV